MHMHLKTGVKLPDEQELFNTEMASVPYCIRVMMVSTKPKCSTFTSIILSQLNTPAISSWPLHNTFPTNIMYAFLASIIIYNTSLNH
jgi:hypothetical protein